MISTPRWVKNAVFYQIFPDRFARGSRRHSREGLSFKPWGSPPEQQGFQGGDLYGIVERLDYLQDLGVTALYLNPIFASAANHRYHTFDYFQVDPILGGNDALRVLLDAAHTRGMYVVLDGVFNHASRGFWPFHHVLENGSNSPYIDWFIIHGWPLRPYASDAQHPANYAAWWNLPALPKLNTRNPAVRDYILRIARHWIDFGIDGWRLDVPEEIDDPAFWRAFRQTVKKGNNEAYLVGEIWEVAKDWLQGDQFDALMNYPFMWATLSFFGAQTLNPAYQRDHLILSPLDAPAFSQHIDRMLSHYDEAVNQVQLNLLGSHDTARALWIMGGDVSALKLSVLFQMTMPGAPCIYYGDEIGLSAADDPHCREAFPWHALNRWNTDLRSFYRAAITLRHQHPVLRTGAFSPIYAEGEVYAYQRQLGNQVAIIALNTGATAHTLTLPTPADTLAQAWPATDAPILKPKDRQIRLTIPPREALVALGCSPK